MGPNKVHEGKKQLLQKLMSNLLSKPGRSFHELSNGVKQAISTYKNFSKEFDQAHGMAPQQSQNGVQRVMQSVQQKKSTDGSGGPGMQPMPAQPAIPATPAQTQVPPVRINGGEPVSPIAGQDQTSTFNRPAPVNSLGIWGH